MIADERIKISSCFEFATNCGKIPIPCAWKNISLVFDIRAAEKAIVITAICMIYAFENLQPKIHQSVFVAENAAIIGDVEIGEDSCVWFGSVVRGDVNYIKIGARTNIQDGSVIHVSSKTHPTVLEDEVTLGHRVTLHGCYIETGCLIGIGAIILDGVRVGRDSLVAAGSLLTPNTQIAPRSLVMGSPARVKRQLSTDEIYNLARFWQNYTKLSKVYKKEQD